MKNSFALLFLLSILVLPVPGAFAGSPEEEDPGIAPAREVHEQTSYVTLNIGVEITGLGKAAADAAQGLNLIGESLHELANDPELSDEHQEQINLTLRRVDKLGQSLTLMVDQFPTTVEQSMVPVVNAANELSAQARKIVIITGIVIILIIFAALAAVYYFVLAPGTRSVVKTANLLDELATALKTTAEIVEVSSERNAQVMEEIQSFRG
jgi:hypothetical protein